MSVGHTATDRHGKIVLFVVFMCMLGGRFTLDRVSPALPALDLRFVGLAGALTLFGMWVTAAGDRMARPVKVGAGLRVFLLWCGYLALSSLWADEQARIGRYLLDLFFLATFVLLALVVLSRLSSQATTVVWAWSYVVGLLYCAGALAAGPDMQGRYAAFGGGPNVFVRVLILALVAALFYAVATGRLRWLLVAAPVFLSGAILSGSRGGLFAFALVLLLGGLPLLRRLPRRTAVLAVAAVGGLVVSAPSLLEGALQHTIQERFIEQTLEAQYTSGRSDITVAGLQLFKDHFLVGTGLDGYYANIGYIVGYEYPHNLFLASAAEGGLVGLLLVLGAVLAFVWRLGRHRPLSHTTLFALLGGMYVLAASMFSGDYYDSRFIWFFLGWAAIEAHRPAEEVDSSTESVPASASAQMRPKSRPS